MRLLDFQNIRKILVRSTNWIGDAVMTTPALGAIREAFPDAEITVAANPIVAELLSPHPCCDRVLVFDKKCRHRGVSGFLSFCRDLRREEFDLAVLFQNAIEAAIMALVARIPRRAGYRTDGRGCLLTHGVGVSAGELRLHHTDYYLHMLGSLGIVGGDRKLKLACTAAEEEWAAAMLKASPAWAAINPGAAFGSAKRWFPERFAAVADAISQKFGCSILLTGSRSEVIIGQEIASAMHTPCFNMVGRTSVREMMALLSNCRLMITNDSGPMHVAAALGVPLVALFGSTDHTTTSPFTDSCRVVRKPVDCAPCLKRHCPTDHRCMEAISVEDVLKAVKELKVQSPELESVAQIRCG